MRIARPSRNLKDAAIFYEDGLGFVRTGGFTGHAGYDGVFFEVPGQNWHLELTTHRSGQPHPHPTDEDLLVLYVSPAERDRLAARLYDRGFGSHLHPNPYWEGASALSFVDPDGYTVVLCPAS